MTSRRNSHAARSVRVLYSFPHRIGAGRICLTAWQQVVGVCEAGAEVTVVCGSVERPLPAEAKVVTSLSCGPFRLPFRLVGRNRALAIHDWFTSRWLEANSKKVDVVHCWPGASLKTIRTASRLGIPTLLERPNAHTAYAFEASAEEARKCGVQLPQGHDHSFNRMTLDLEQREYAECDFLLCPSDFVAKTFRDRGFSDTKLLRHQYGFDAGRFHPAAEAGPPNPGLVVLYAGVCEPRKGLHYALEAWLASEASRTGRFLICGTFVPGYREAIEDLLSHPSIDYLGQRDDLPEIMRKADVFVLSSVEEGSALVTYEAKGSGCVLVVSDASGAKCTHGKDALVHPMRSVKDLVCDLNRLHEDRGLLAALRHETILDSANLTWAAAGIRLSDIYHDVRWQSAGD